MCIISSCRSIVVVTMIVIVIGISTIIIISIIINIISIIIIIISSSSSRRAEEQGGSHPPRSLPSRRSATRGAGARTSRRRPSGPSRHLGDSKNTVKRVLFKASLDSKNRRGTHNSTKENIRGTRYPIRRMDLHRILEKPERRGRASWPSSACGRWAAARRTTSTWVSLLV